MKSDQLRGTPRNSEEPKKLQRTLRNSKKFQETPRITPGIRKYYIKYILLNLINTEEPKKLQRTLRNSKKIQGTPRNSEELLRGTPPRNSSEELRGTPRLFFFLSLIQNSRSKANGHNISYQATQKCIL